MGYRMSHGKVTQGLVLITEFSRHNHPINDEHMTVDHTIKLICFYPIIYTHISYIIYHIYNMHLTNRNGNMTNNNTWSFTGECWMISNIHIGGWAPSSWCFPTSKWVSVKTWGKTMEPLKVHNIWWQKYGETEKVWKSVSPFSLAKKNVHWSIHQLTFQLRAAVLIQGDPIRSIKDLCPHVIPV